MIYYLQITNCSAHSAVGVADEVDRENCEKYVYNMQNK